MSPLLQFLADPAADRIKFFDAPSTFILDLLNVLAYQSERGLDIVISALRDTHIKVAAKYPQTAGHLSWYAEQIEERFRGSFTVPIPLQKAKDLVEICIK